jgi:hypothetical protein
MATNIWVKAWNGRIIRESQVQEVSPGNDKGWWVIAVLGRKEQVALAKIGRGGRSEAVAKRLAAEWPQAIAAAKPGDTIQYMDGQWSTLAAARAVPAPED